MKQTIKLLTVLLMLGCYAQTSSAQAKRKPATKSAVKKPAAKVNNNFAIVHIDDFIDQPLFEDEENIYFLGSRNGDYNTLRAVNKQTGDFKLVVPKKKRARPTICCAGSDGKNVYMRVENKGIARFNGTDVNTSELVLAQSPQFKGFLIFGNRGDDIVCSPNGRYVMMYGDTPIEYDLETKKVVGFGINSTQDAVITNDGMVIGLNCDEIFTAPKNPNPSIEPGSPKNRVGRTIYELSKIGNGAGGSFCNMWYDVAADTIYVALGEQVLKTPAKAQMKFEEVYCLPGENKKFTDYVCNGQRVFATTDNYEKRFYEWDNKDMKGTPKISKELDTGIIDKRGWAGNTTTEKVGGADRLYYDQLGNLWMKTGDGKFVIYNPDGIKGLTKLIGKITEDKLPPEED